MKIPIVIRSNKILDRLGIFMKIGGITLWPFIIIRPNRGEVTINHEYIHIKQQQELLVIPFYILYVLEWLIRLIQYKDTRKAYYNITFEREAYRNEKNLKYLQKRELFSWVKYINKI